MADINKETFKEILNFRGEDDQDTGETISPGNVPVYTSQKNLDDFYLEQLNSIKEEVTCLRSELACFVQRANQQYVQDMIEEMKKNLKKPVLDYLCNEAKERMHTKMTPGCEMRDFCEIAFGDILQETAGLVGKSKIETETIKMYRSKLDELKKEAKTSNCNRCFSEASDLFEKQVKLMHSLQIYEDRDENSKKLDISEIEPDILVSEVCEPIANKQRLIMLKALSGESKTFSELSKLTGLRGGNLLFHLQKLLETGMVLQRNERGDYIITRKGYSTLDGLSRIYSEIKQE